MEPERIAFISLGCPKNQVDSEMMLKKLCDAGYEIIDSPLGADLVIINTCGFIEEAKQEAIDTIIEMGGLKENGDVGKILVIGCMAERYRDEILSELPEADAVAGLGINGDIVSFVREVLSGGKTSSFPDKMTMPIGDERLLSTPDYWAYLKVAEGCSNCCTYCAIPAIRGKYRSRPLPEVVAEAQKLVAGGVKELIVVAQDTTRYGEDLYGKPALPELIYRLNEIEGLKWIRLLYCYPDRISDELLTAMRDCEKALHYIDLPLQHSDPRILRAMNRRGSGAEYLALLEKIRAFMPDCTVRTTFITGFPGEDEEAFDNLSEFIRDARFDRLGCFAFSPEEGTPAAKMENDVPREEAQRRAEILMEQQYRIVEEKQKALVGKTVECVVEDYEPYSDYYLGRTVMDAPEIDGVIRFVSEDDLENGDFVSVIIREPDEYDLIGEKA